MAEVIIDGVMVREPDDVHRILDASLGFGPYYGSNFSALWDTLTANVERPVRIIWRNAEISRQNLGDEQFGTFVNLFRNAAERDVKRPPNERLEFVLEYAGGGTAAVAPYTAAPPLYFGAPPPVSAGAMAVNRLLATILDGLILFGSGLLPAAGISAGVAAIAPTTVTPGPCDGNDSIGVTVAGGCEAPMGWVMGVTGVVMFAVLLVSFYLVVFRPQGLTGQTYGMRAIGIKVVDATSMDPIGVRRSILRQLAKVLSAVPCYLGFFLVFIDPRQQALHDKLVGTVVVRV